jgi:phosphate transport system substrate-binding protein
MKLFLRAIGLVALPALLVSACSNGSSGTGVPSQGFANAPSSVRPHDNGPQDLHAGGATFPAYAYNLASQPTGLASQPQAAPGTGSLFASAGTTGTVYYCLTGSGFGRKVFDGATPANSTAACAALGLTATGFGGEVDPPDFVGSDVALASTEYTTYKTNREPSTGTNYGEPFEFPSIGGPIVFGYPRSDFPKLKKENKAIQLSVWSYCALANGTITDWNDPAITADNGDISVTNGKSEPITFYYRSDSAGTSFLFTTHLATVCGSAWLPPYSKKPYQSAKRNAAWTFGVSSTWPGPGCVPVAPATTCPGQALGGGKFIGENGNPGVLAAIQATPYAAGYLEGAYAKSVSHPSIGQAWLQNSQGKFVDPTVPANVLEALKDVQLGSVTFGGGSDVPNQLATTRPECIFFVNPTHFTNPLEKEAYPIVGISYLLFYGNNNGVHVADKKTLINFIESSAGNAITSSLEYAPLSKGLQNGILAAANGTGSYAGKPCIQ